MENNKKKNIYTLILVILGVILLGIGLVSLLNKNNNSGNSSKFVETGEFKTADNKFTLKVVNKNDTKAKDDYLKTHEDDINLDDVKYFAYFNNSVIYITNIYKEDSNYIVFEFDGYKNAESSGYTLVIDKNTNTLKVNPEDLADKDSNCMENGFCGMTPRMSFIKTDLGYFFIDLSYNNYVLYTTSWKKLGYVKVDMPEEYSDSNYKLVDVDSTGVIVYSEEEASECIGNECSWILLNPIKYDVNGNVVSN